MIDVNFLLQVLVLCLQLILQALQLIQGVAQVPFGLPLLVIQASALKRDRGLRRETLHDRDPIRGEGPRHR